MSLSDSIWSTLYRHFAFKNIKKLYKLKLRNIKLNDHFSFSSTHIHLKTKNEKLKLNKELYRIQIIFISFEIETYGLFCTTI